MDLPILLFHPYYIAASCCCIFLILRGEVYKRKSIFFDYDSWKYHSVLILIRVESFCSEVGGMISYTNAQI